MLTDKELCDELARILYGDEAGVLVNPEDALPLFKQYAASQTPQEPIGTYYREVLCSEQMPENGTWYIKDSEESFTKANFYNGIIEIYDTERGGYFKANPTIWLEPVKHPNKEAERKIAGLAWDAAVLHNEQVSCAHYDETLISAPDKTEYLKAMFGE